MSTARLVVPDRSPEKAASYPGLEIIANLATVPEVELAVLIRLAGRIRRATPNGASRAGPLFCIIPLLSIAASRQPIPSGRDLSRICIP